MINKPYMTKGKQWPPQQEAELKKLVESNTNIETIAATLGKTPGAIIVKCNRLGLKLQTKGYIDKSLVLPKDLLSVEETLKMLTGALKTSGKSGLTKLDLQRLQVIATISKTYKEILDDYINYREIELQLKQMKDQNDKLLK